jgi:serine/threonine protein phosphatase PrpC
MGLTETAQARCPGCQAPSGPGDVFCERCGARLAGEEQTPAADGDRVEVDQGIAAAISDRGRVHRRNEDAFGLQVQGDRLVAAVVCDGISSASAGDAAARQAADSAAARLSVALLDRRTDGHRAVAEAVSAAHGSVARVPWTSRIDRDSPSCTLVCALYREEEIIVGSVGDSRAYWLGANGNRQLTTDDSWAEEQVSAGAVTAEQAMSDPRAHTITHWIGGDAPDRPPRVITLRADHPGRLLLCTDGLWNYAPGAAELGDLLSRLPPRASAAAAARALTDIALERGGRDNITVSIVDVHPSGGNP